MYHKSKTSISDDAKKRIEKLDELFNKVLNMDFDTLNKEIEKYCKKHNTESINHGNTKQVQHKLSALHSCSSYRCCYL
jgi:phage host-nuclease inhibitor protein Gam